MNRPATLAPGDPSVAHAYYLAGDSYPGDLPVEEALTGRLTQAGIEVISQERILALSGLERFEFDAAERVRRLGEVIARAGRDELPFLIGRSSGARIATLAAGETAVAGVICLAYPFRAPGRVIDPARFAHLAHLTTPTLILQGENDSFGGRGLTRDYALSPSISLRFTTANHMVKLGPRGWDDVAGRIADFIAGGGRCDAASAEPFDEAFYLDAYPDVATMIAVGKFTCGEQHYELRGRRQGRMYQTAPRKAAEAAPEPAAVKTSA